MVKFGLIQKCKNDLILENLLVNEGTEGEKK